MAEGAAGGLAIEPVYDVRIRTGYGPFLRESLVWQGLQEGPKPVPLPFIEADRPYLGKE